MPRPSTGPVPAAAPDINSSEYIFSQIHIQDKSTILRDISLNVPHGQTAPTKQSNPDQSHNSSLGLLPPDAMSGMATFSMGDTSTTSFDMENCPPSNISLGRYLQPAHTSMASQSEPLSDSDDDSDPPQTFTTVPHPHSYIQEQEQALFETPQHSFLVPFPVHPSITRHPHTSSTPLQAAPPRCGSQREKVLATTDKSGWDNLSSNCPSEFNASGGFPWDKIVKRDTLQDISSLQKQLSPDLSTLSDSWHQKPQDPSFCSGKFSARSTSFGGGNNTRDENFSDFATFATVPSFQSQGSFSSHYTTNNVEDIVFHSGFPVQTSSDVFQGFDAAAQAELGVEFGDQEFGSFGKDQLKCFLDQEEAECLQANPFIEEEQCEEPANSSIFSGVSDKSIMLRNSNLWGGDTSQVNLGQLRMENQVQTKVSRCEYFRHNSSRLGSLEETIPDCERPGLGFVHHIRSPERRPCALLSETVSGSEENVPTPLSSTCSLEQEKAKGTQGRVSNESGNSDSAPSSANTTYTASGNSTKTVVSMLEQSGTLKADELASRLQTLADQLGCGQAQNVSYPDVVEDSMASNTSNLVMDGQLEASIQESFGAGTEINLSTISRVLSDASVSNDPQHFVSVLLGCLKKREQVGREVMDQDHRGGNGESYRNGEKVELETEVKNISKNEDYIDNIRSMHKLSSNTPSSSSSSVRMSNTNNTPVPPFATLPRTKKSCTPPTTSTRLSHTPLSKMTPTVSKRAMLRLTPSSAEPLSRVSQGVRPMSGHSKPIKPFSVVSSGQHSQVAPVKPQQSIKQTPSLTSSAPTSARATPTPSLSKTTSLPSSLNASNRQRRPSGTRHSSPIKKTVTIKSPPTNSASTPNTNDLSQLLDCTESPTLHLASTSHLTTSTPFHPGLNLSKVILDHLTHNQSISPLVNPNTSISPVSLDISTISPALYTSLVRPTNCFLSVEQETHLPPQATIELPPDWSHNCVVSSHTKVVVSVPVKHNLTSTSSMAMKVTSMWVGSCLVPHNHWEQLVDTKWETLITLNQEKNSFDMEFLMKKGGAFTLNIAVMLDNGNCSSGLLRIQVEETNIQVLTDNGSKIDFGSLPQDCSSSVHLVLVNCGMSSVPLHLSIRQPNDLFSFVGEAKDIMFNIPGVTGDLSEGQGVAKDIELYVNTGGISVTEPKVFQTELLVQLGEKNKCILLGSLDIIVKVGTARLRTKKSAEPVLFNCLPGETITQSIQLKNCGNITLGLETMVEDTTQGIFSYDKNVKISPDCHLSLAVTFTCSPQANLTTSQHLLNLMVTHNGPKHLITLQTNVVGNKETIQEFRSSRPVLSFGVLKKPETMSSSQAIPTVFPVESDRSLVNFFSVPVGTREEQLITLRNSTSEMVCINMIIRETDNFFLLVPAGAVSTSQLVLNPQDSQDVKVLYCPTKVGTEWGKLVLKPQGRKVGGKSFKASISLCGLAGSCNIEMEGLEEVETKRYQLSCQQLPVKKMVSFFNKGESCGFVKIISGGDKLDITPAVFLLDAGVTKDVYISYFGSDAEYLCAPPLVTIFSGPELVRQVLKRARLLPGAARLSENPSLMGINFTEDFHGEEIIKAREEFSGQLTALDVKHFYQKTVKHQVCLTMPQRPAEFDQLAMEETLSDTRIDQSIALPLHTTNKTMSHQARPSNTFQHPTIPTHAKSSTFSPHMANSPPTTDSHLLLIPRHLALPSGGEAIVKVVNKSPHPVHWDLSWPSCHLSISPGAGLLSPQGQAVVCVQAVPGQAGWRGEVSVYSDNSVDTMEVVVTHVVPSTCITVTTDQVDFGMGVLGSTTNSSIMVTNPGIELVQWKAQVSPSFFSLPQCAGLLNPTQSITLPLLFKPAAIGSHTATLTLTATPVRGGQDMTQSGPPVLITMRGMAVSGTEAMSTVHNPPPGQTKPQSKKNTGTVSLESELVMFPDTIMGETSVSKVKIKNRSGSDQAVEIMPLPTDSPFKTVHSVLEVKNQCYCTVPVQFRPMDRGEQSTNLIFKWEGNMVNAMLRGKAVQRGEESFIL